MKIILIDDNKKRQQELYGGKSLEQFDILVNAIDNQYDDLFKQLRNETFEADNYDLIMVHESAFENQKSKIIDYLMDINREFDIPLVFFSGGIIGTTYQSNPQRLYLTDKIFYKNLELFLNNLDKTKNINLKMLAYGKNWEINTLDTVLVKIKQYLSKIAENKIRFRKFNKEVQLDSIDDFISKDDIKLDGDKISRDEIEKLYQKIVKEVENKMEDI